MNSFVGTLNENDPIWFIINKNKEFLAFYFKNKGFSLIILHDSHYKVK